MIMSSWLCPQLYDPVETTCFALLTRVHWCIHFCRTSHHKMSSVFKGLLPRGKMPNPLRERNAKVNQLVQEAVSSLPHASFLSVDPGFVHSSGSISHQDMYDYLHLTPRGYQAVCEPLHAQLKSMLDEPSENWAAAAHLKWLSSLFLESITLNIFTCPLTHGIHF